MNNNNKETHGKDKLFYIQKLNNLIKMTRSTEIFWLGDRKKNKWTNRFNKIKYYHYKYFIFRLSQIRPFIFSIKTFFGLRLYFRVPEHYYFLLWGFFPEAEQTNEANLTTFLIKNFKKGDIFFDVGANCGFYSVLAKKFIGENGQIHAFEPTPICF